MSDENRYLAYDRSAELKRIDHRTFVGGMWDELGQLQFEFVRRRGLQAENSFLDVGCGCLRGGLHFIRFLDTGNYYGMDASQALLEAGYNIELEAAGLTSKLPRSNLLCSRHWEFEKLEQRFDLAIAQSLFSHLTWNSIRQCLARLRPFMNEKSIFYATFFEASTGRISTPCEQALGVTSYPDHDPYHYYFQDLKYAARSTGWTASYIGEWGHPRGQKMIACKPC